MKTALLQCLCREVADAVEAFVSAMLLCDSFIVKDRGLQKASKLGTKMKIRVCVGYVRKSEQRNASQPVEIGLQGCVRFRIV